VGFIDSSGYLHIVDRDGDVINVGGTKIYSLEVEAKIAELPQIVDVAVIGVPHKTLGEHTVAAVVFDRSASLAEIRAEMHLRLGPRDMPHQVIPLIELPRNSGGKVDKLALRALATGLMREVASEPSGSGSLATRVKRAWEDVLELKDIDPYDNFFALGGSSLNAMRIVTRLSEELDVDLPTEAYFDWTTISDMTNVIDGILMQTEGQP
jgi:acyl carrier protein